MRRPFHFVVTLIVFAALLSGASGATAQDTGPQPILIPDGGSPLTTAFTYQGVLKVGSTPFNGTCQKLDFYLFDVANPPNGYPQLGLIQLTGVPISNGLLNISLDFGASVFNGERRWLQIQHDCNNTGGTFVMTPTQELKASPYAFFATKAPWTGLLGVPGGFADNVDNDTTYSPGFGLTLSGTQFIVDFLGTGSANTVARSDHNHNGVYAPVSHTHSGADITSTVQTAVTATVALDVNCASGCVSASEIDPSGLTVPTATVALSATTAPWSGLTGIPADLADGDNDTQYTAGNGLTLNGTVFSVITDGITANMVQFNYAGSASEGGPATSALTATTAPWGGLTGIPAGFADNVDNDTQYTAGDGLTLGGVGNTVFSVITGGITSSMILTNTIISTNVDSTSIQLRVNEACEVGSTIRVINADGTVVCEYVSPRPEFSIATADTTNVTGQHTSVVVGVDGLGLISYYDASTQELKVAHCNDVACTSVITTTIDTAGNVGQFSSLTIGADGLGLVSYYDASAGDLKAAHCNNVTCTTSSVALALDTTNNVGQYTSLVIGADGLGLISYYDASSGNLKVAHCSDVACSNTTAAPATLDSTGNVGQFTSVTIGADGLGVITYYDDTNDDLKVAHCSNLDCTSTSTPPAALDSTGNVGQFTSVTMVSSGLALSSYYDVTNGDLKVITFICTSVACPGGFAIVTLDTNGDVGQYTSITVGEDGVGLVSYYDVTNGDLKVVHCAAVVCGNGFAPPVPVTLDSATDVGQFGSVTIGVDGMPLISYYEAGTADNLKVAHCSNSLCIPYFRRR